MERKVLMTERTATQDGLNGRGASGRRSRIVIADSGVMAEVLVFPPGEPLDRGTVFRHRGTTWVVTGMRRDSGILVARPEAH